MKKFISCFAVIFLLLLSGCKFFETEVAPSTEVAREIALSCFEKHKDDMLDIINSESAIGSTDWCQKYNLLSDKRYEFVLHQSGFTGTNTKTGIVYLPDDTPEDAYTQSEENSNIYSYENGSADKDYLERLECNWFFFYSTYDF